jgi:hypothetical protein
MRPETTQSQHLDSSKMAHQVRDSFTDVEERIACVNEAGLKRGI